MMQVFTQLFKLPLQAFVFSMQILATAAEGFRKLAGEGIETVLGGTDIKKETGGSQIQTSNFVPANPGTDNTTEATHTSETTREEEKTVSTSCDDTNLGNLDGKELKLVRYKILFVKRGYEHAFPEQEELVSDNFEDDDCGFTAWKIAEFIQSLSEIPIPHKWKQKKYPKYPEGDPYDAYPHEPHKEETSHETKPHGSSADSAKSAKNDEHQRNKKGEKGPFIYWLTEEDKKYLRVYYQVLARYKREPQQEQVEVLQQIRDILDR